MKLCTQFLFALVFLLSSLASAKTLEVKMKSISYEPKQLEIVQGQSVIWKNVAYTEHSATADEGSPALETGLVQPGKESKPITFDKPGTYAYHCRVHGRTMSGTIIVKAPQE